MDSRFKFRAWDKRYSKYYYDTENTFEENQVLGIDYFGQYLNDDDFIVEQSTGLRDKNGKLIYEYDVLKDHRGDVCVVFWDKDLASFALIKTDLKTYYSPIDTDITNFEIIGNIHENKLEAK